MVLHDLILLGLVATLAWAAVSDGLWFRIPNAVSLTVLGIYPLYLLVGGTITAETQLAQVHWALLIAIGVFLVGMLLFSLGAMGGGDVKLLTVLSLWAGPAFFPLFILITAVAGGVLTLIVLLAGRFPFLQLATTHLRIAMQLPDAPRTAGGKRTIPYGIAIAFGGLALCAALYRAGHS